MLVKIGPRRLAVRPAIPIEIQDRGGAGPVLAGGFRVKRLPGLEGQSDPVKIRIQDG